MIDNDEKETLSNNFPSNSRMKKAEPVTPEETKPKVQKVVTGIAKKQKRSFGKKLAETFLEDDTKSVGKYVIHDILIPAGKSLICDIVGWGGFAEMMLFGDRRASRGGTSSIRRDSGPSRVNYGSYSRDTRSDQRDRPREISRVGRARHDFDEVVIPTRGEAEEVLSHLFDLTMTYGFASVADLYELTGIDSNFTDNKFGWTDLRGVSPIRVKDGYLLNLPRVSPLD